MLRRRDDLLRGRSNGDDYVGPNVHGRKHEGADRRLVKRDVVEGRRGVGRKTVVHGSRDARSGRGDEAKPVEDRADVLGVMNNDALLGVLTSIERKLEMRPRTLREKAR